MTYCFSIEGTLMGIPGPAAGIPMKTEGPVDGLSPDIKAIVLKLIASPNQYQYANYNIQPDEGKYNFEIEADGQKHVFHFSDFNTPEEVQPLITYLRKKAYG